MPVITPAIFREALMNSAENTLAQYILSGVPYVFRNRPRGYDEIKLRLANLLGVDPRFIRIVGSAHLGFCGKVKEFGRKFKEGCDVDTIIVSETMFDSYWHSLLKWHSSMKWSIPLRFRDIAVDHHERSIYWGHMWPDVLVRASATVPTWTAAFRSLSDVPELAPYEVNGRLYRTWEHVNHYHLDSLRWLKFELQKKKGS